MNFRYFPQISASQAALIATTSHKWLQFVTRFFIFQQKRRLQNEYPSAKNFAPPPAALLLLPAARRSAPHGLRLCAPPPAMSPPLPFPNSARPEHPVCTHNYASAMHISAFRTAYIPCSGISVPCRPLPPRPPLHRAGLCRRASKGRPAAAGRPIDRRRLRLRTAPAQLFPPPL